MTALAPLAGPASRHLVPSGIALVAAAIFVFRAVRTALGDGLPPGEPVGPGVAWAGAAAALALAGAAVVRRSRMAAALAWTLALVLEFLVLDGYAAPPRLIAAIPLFAALALTVATPSRTGGVVAQQRERQVAGIVALVAMGPVGFFYLLSGLVVPGPWLFGFYALFGAWLVLAVWLYRRRSWWALAVPPVAFATWMGLLSLGENLLGWTA